VPEEPKGKLTIFLGSAAGVGKTYTMLSEAKQQKRLGVDVRVGYIESHGREDTEEMIGDLPVIPRQVIEYRGSSFEEMDLDAVLGAHPQLVLVDEMAHTNVPGSEHRKRYQDIEVILDQGINVWTTVNIQHLESLNDLVFELTGVKIRETFPDYLLERAEQIRLIDISPEALIERIKEGKVYPPGKIETALSNFFRKSNLTALRELALREVADEVEETIEAEETPMPASAEKIMVCVRPETNAQRLIRRAWRVSKRLNAGLIVVYVRRTPRWGRRKSQELREKEEGERVASLRDLSKTLGADFIELGAPEAVPAIIDIAGERKVTQIFMGRPRSLNPFRRARNTLLYRIMSQLSGVDVHVISEDPRLRFSEDGD
jgi:two-component system, OmpR family, sensor histidine kinase KdpD